MALPGAGSSRPESWHVRGMEGDLSQVLLVRTEEVLASWSHRYDRSSLRVPRKIDPRQQASVMQSMVIALGETVQEPAVYKPTGDTDRVRRGTIPPQRL